MSVDLSKVRQGDEVTVRAIFVRIGLHGHPIVRVTTVEKGLSNEGSVSAQDIVSHTPKALSVGDLVASRVGPSFTFKGPILAIHGDWAWLGDAHDSGVVRRLSTLERVP